MTMRPAIDRSPSDWIVTADERWFVLATYGPPGLDDYARVAIAADDEHPWEVADNATYVDPDRRRWETVVSTLAGFTTSPDRVHLAVWEGVEHVPPGVHFSIPARTYALSTGTVEDCLDRNTLGRFAEDFGQYEIPHLLWPDDESWIIVWDTDEENYYTVAGSQAAVAAVLDIPGLRGSVVPYATPEDGWTW